jgi:rhamnogalacturonan endolyase
MRKPFLSGILFTALLLPAEGAVTIRDDGRVFILANGFLTAQVNKSTGDLTSLKVKTLELMGYASGHHAGYWEQSPAKSAQLSASLTIDPAANNGERGEVSIKGLNIPGLNFDLEIRYALASEDRGLYTYAIFSHQPGYAKIQVGESRYGAKLSSAVFDWMSIDAHRNLLMPTGADWDHGSPLNMKEARRLTTGIYKGRAEHKYDYSAIQSEIPAFGWSSTREHLGFFLINPSMEFLSGGPTKVELTGHLDDNDGGDPTILDYWRGTHYGGSFLPLSEGEAWTKVVGPILIYIPQAPTPDAMFQDALAQAKKEAAKWPYDWVQGVDYPHKPQRAIVSGQLSLIDPAAKSLPNLWVGLAAPDAVGMTWQNDAKHYEFWERGTVDGHFSIPNVRPGTYELHAIADGVLGEYSKASITIAPGARVDLGKLEWKPVRYGRQMWDIGIPNRSGSEFFKGDDYFHWGWYLEYPKLFPNDLHYTIGKSDYRKDWFFEQVPRAGENDGTGRGNGAATTWTIDFPLASAVTGKGILRLAITGVGARRIDVAVNGKPAGVVDGLVYNATINRDGIQGHWVEKDVTFDAALLQAGHNQLTLTIPAGGLTSGIIYDYLRLELAP